jgi:hypothetical protein
MNALSNTDALLARIRQHDACGCAECEDGDPPLPMMLVWTAIAIPAWALFGWGVVALIRHVGGAV